MKINIKAALLSAFVLPGIGQIHNGSRIKGGILLFLSNIFLLSAFFLVFKEMGPVILGTKLSGKVDVAMVTRKLEAGAPAAKVILALFFALWIYGIVDALIDRHTGENSHDGNPK